MRATFPRAASDKRGLRPRARGTAHPMAAFIAIVLAALLLAFGFAFAAPWLVIVPVAIVIVLVIWGGALVVAHWTPEEAVRRTPKADLLGPGGPDDPDSGRAA